MSVDDIPTPRAQALFDKLHGAVEAEMVLIRAEADIDHDPELWRCWSALRDSLYHLNGAAGHLAIHERLTALRAAEHTADR